MLVKEKMRLEQNLLTLWFRISDTALPHGGGSPDIKAELKTRPRLRRRMLLWGLLHYIEALMNAKLGDYRFLKQYLETLKESVQDVYNKSRPSEDPNLEENERIREFVDSEEYTHELFRKIMSGTADSIPNQIRWIAFFLGKGDDVRRTWDPLFLGDPKELLSLEDKTLWNYVACMQTLFGDQVANLLSASSSRKKLPRFERERLLILTSLFKSMKGQALGESEFWLKARGLNQESDFLESEERSRK